MNWFNRKGADREDGFLGYLEAAYNGIQGLSFNVRAQYFETEGYNSRIYAYENDVLYSFSIPAFFNKGFRYYANLNVDVFKNLSFYLRFAQSRFKDLSSIGSGLDEIKGNARTEVKMQLVYRFQKR